MRTYDAQTGRTGCRAWRSDGSKVFFKPLGVMWVYHHPELLRAGMKVVQRVEIKVLDVQGEGRGTVSAGDVQIGRMDARGAFAGGFR